MSQSPPPTPYPGQQPPPKYRPRARWFVVGGVLLALAPIVLVAALFTVLAPLLREDAVVPADGRPQQVQVSAGQERALFTPPGSQATCTVTDGSGQQRELRRVGADITVNDWQALARFDTGDGDLTLTCEAAGTPGEVRVGALPSGSTFLVALLVGIVVPLLLGGAGLVVLIVTGVLHASRPPRPSA